MNAAEKRHLKRIRDLFALMGSSNQAESEGAKHKLEEYLKKIGKTWNDLPGLLQEQSPSEPPPPDPRDTDLTEPHPHDKYAPVTTACGIIQQYVALEPHQAMAAALWAIHTHLYDQFMITPRLLLTSPIKNCGKTTLLDVLGRLAARAERHDNITAATIYRVVNASRRTLLLDEADNLEMSDNKVLKSVLNSGHRKGGFVGRTIQGQEKRFSVFAPISLASIGTSTLSPALMSRSIVIKMQRHDNVQLRRFDLDDTTDLDLVYNHIRHWVSKVKLDPDPVMPTELRDGRLKDNWRPLLAIADACGPKFGALARKAAIAFTHSEHDDEDIAVTLLRHIREVFDACAVDRLASQELVRRLIDLEGADGLYASGGACRTKLTQSKLAKMLRLFTIFPGQLWPQPRTAASRSYRGYQRIDFEVAWRSYCDVEPSQGRTRKAAVKRLTKSSAKSKSGSGVTKRHQQKRRHK